VVSADFNSVGSNPSIGAVGSTPSRSRHMADVLSRVTYGCRIEITLQDTDRVK